MGRNDKGIEQGAGEEDGKEKILEQMRGCCGRGKKGNGFFQVN